MEESGSRSGLIIDGIEVMGATISLSRVRVTVSVTVRFRVRDTETEAASRPTESHSDNGSKQTESPAAPDDHRSEGEQPRPVERRRELLGAGVIGRRTAQGIGGAGSRRLRIRCRTLRGLRMSNSVNSCPASPTIPVQPRLEHVQAGNTLQQGHAASELGTHFLPHFSVAGGLVVLLPCPS